MDIGGEKTVTTLECAQNRARICVESYEYTRNNIAGGPHENLKGGYKEFVIGMRRLIGLKNGR